MLMKRVRKKVNITFYYFFRAKIMDSNYPFDFFSSNFHRFGAGNGYLRE